MVLSATSGSSTVEMDASDFTKILVCLYPTALCHTPEAVILIVVFVRPSFYET